MENLVEYGGLGLALAMLIIFFRHLDRRDAALKLIAGDCHAHSERIVKMLDEVIERCNVSLDHNTAVLAEAAVELRTLNQWRDKYGDQFLASLTKRSTQ